MHLFGKPNKVPSGIDLGTKLREHKEKMATYILGKKKISSIFMMHDPINIIFAVLLCCVQIKNATVIT